MRREVDSRIGGGGEQIAVYWDDQSDAVELEVIGADGLPQFATLEPGEARDAIEHPYVYLGRSSVAA